MEKRCVAFALTRVMEKDLKYSGIVAAITVTLMLMVHVTLKISMEITSGFMDNFHPLQGYEILLDFVLDFCVSPCR